MRNDVNNRVSRRRALGGGVATLVALMLDAPRIVEARAQRLQDDGRYPFADRISDLVIPDTDTPGASAAGVAGFVLLALDHGMSDLRPQMLDLVRAALDSRSSVAFMQLPRPHQAAILADYDAQTYAIDQGAESQSPQYASYALEQRPESQSPQYAWRRIKAAIVAGYYTSQIGASKELIYAPVPGSFHNIVLTPDFRSRSNDGLGGQI